MMYSSLRTMIVACALGSAAAAPTLTLAASDYPSRPIKLVVPYPPGGNADNIARVFSKRFSEVLGTAVVIENKPGAAGTIGADAVAKAAPDGYTILLTVTSQLTSAGMNMKPAYDAIRDFRPIAGLAVTPLVFAVSASSSIKSLEDLAKLAKTSQISYGSYGAGTSTHVMQYLLAKQLGAKDMAHIAYKGESPMIVDMLGGQIQMGLVSVGTAIKMKEAGKLLPLAVVGPTRSEFLPDVKTFKEQGYERLDWTYGVAVYGSTKLPSDVLGKLEAAAQTVVANPEVRDAYKAQFNQPWTVTPAVLQERLVVDTERWNKVLAEVGVIE